ncbi:MAG: hypothetical protein Q9201_003663 [Fulgogasparrea decipioides]
MAPPHTPRTPRKPKTDRMEAIIRTKTKFFYAIDHRGRNTIEFVCNSHGIPRGTGKFWLQQRKQLGTSTACTRTGAQRTGRPLKLSDEQLDLILSPSRNPLRHAYYQAQIKNFSLNYTPRTLEHALITRRNKARRYKRARINVISQGNRLARENYGAEHGDKHLDLQDPDDFPGLFWKHIGFADEAYKDPSDMHPSYVTREQGTRYEPENLIEIPPKQGVALHFAAWVSWYYRSDLIFYNNPAEWISHIEVEHPNRIRPPKKWKKETQK